MTRDVIKVLEIDRVAAATFIADRLELKFELARDRTPLEEEVAAEAESLASYLLEADTRTCCILAVSFLEDTLKKNFIEKWKIVTREGLDTHFGSNGPISSLLQRTVVAQALQWLPMTLVKEVDLLRKIRNEFAHNHRVHSLLEEPLQSYAARLDERERVWDIDGADMYRAAYRTAAKETQLRMRVYCCVLFAVSQILARSKLINHDIPPSYRDEGFVGLTRIEQDLIDTMIKYCLCSLNIKRTGL